MAKHLAPRSLKQRLQESIKSAMRGYKHLVDIERVLEAYMTANDGKKLEVLKVDMSLMGDVMACLLVSGTPVHNEVIDYQGTALRFVSKEQV